MWYNVSAGGKLASQLPVPFPLQVSNFVQWSEHLPHIIFLRSSASWAASCCVMLTQQWGGGAAGTTGGEGLLQ
jgi:hypothetical protein